MELTLNDHVNHLITFAHHPMVMAECLQGNLQCSGTGGTEGDASIQIIEAYRGFESFINVMGMIVMAALLVGAGISLFSVTLFYYGTVFTLFLFSILVTVIPARDFTDLLAQVKMPVEVNIAYG